jgi:predicted nuclease of predicted toxin-antitoxin system
MKILINMNLSPEWVDYLQREGYIATHWRDIGSFEAKDIEITKWAAERDYLIFTNDLDFAKKRGQVLLFEFARCIVKSWPDLCESSTPGLSPM